MAGQIDDDWYGRYLDPRLAVDSFALAAIREKGSVEEAYKFLMDIKKSYSERAVMLGLSKVGATSLLSTHKLGQKIMRGITLAARTTGYKKLKDMLQEKVVPKLGVREQLYAKGII